MDAFGTTLAREGALVGTFEPIAKVTSLSPPSMSRDTYDETAHDSLDGWREFSGGLKDGGEVSFDVRYNPSVHDTLVADFEDVDPRAWQITFPDATVWAFSAILTGFEADAPFDGQLAASLTLKVSGKPTLTPAP